MKKKNLRKMKKNKTSFNLINSLILLAILFGFATSCSDDDNPKPVNNTIAVLLSNGNKVKLFTKALDRVDFLDNLHGTKKYTVFAPDDDAFENFLEEYDYDNISDVPKEELKKIILNHIIPTNVLTTEDLLDMDNEYQSTSAEYSLFISGDDGEISLNGNTKLDNEAIDVEASNGIIHLASNVITTPTVATFLELDTHFSSFYEGLTTSTPDTDFIASLKSLETDDDSEAPFTVFAPNNEAIEALLEANENWESLDDINKSSLTSILEHHIIVNKAILKEDLDDGLENVETLEGDSLSFTESDGDFMITDGSGNEDIKILLFDIKTQNGIIHTIGSVLIPNTEG